MKKKSYHTTYIRSQQLTTHKMYYIKLPCYSNEYSKRYEKINHQITFSMISWNLVNNLNIPCFHSDTCGRVLTRTSLVRGQAPRQTLSTHTICACLCLAHHPTHDTNTRTSRTMITLYADVDNQVIGTSLWMSSDQAWGNTPKSGSTNIGYYWPVLWY